MRRVGREPLTSVPQRHEHSPGTSDRERRTLRPAPLRRLGATLALWFWASQVLGGLHLATVLHGRCAEHGEVVHVEGHGGSTDGGSTDGGAGLGQGAEGGDSHDHCVVVASRETPADVPVLAVADFARPPADFVPPIALRPIVRPTERRYLLAPKTSPPV